MELEIGQYVELMGVENAGLDITGARGTVTEMAHGMVSVTLDASGAAVSAWPENLKMLRDEKGDLIFASRKAEEVKGMKPSDTPPDPPAPPPPSET